MAFSFIPESRSASSESAVNIPVTGSAVPKNISDSHRGIRQGAEGSSSPTKEKGGHPATGAPLKAIIKDKRVCPHCGSPVKTSRYERHVAERCPKVVRTSKIALLHVCGIGGHNIALDENDLAQIQQQIIAAVDENTPVTFNGVLLSDILKKVNTPSGSKYLDVAASYYLVAEGRTGRRVVFAWAELDSKSKQIYVVRSKNGKPLSDRSGPLRLVVAYDNGDSRSLVQLSSLKLRQAKANGSG